MVAAQFADAVMRSATRLRATWLGYTYGLVVDNRDPKGRGRIRVRLPWHGEDYATDWIPKLAGFNTPGGGETFSVPEIGHVVEIKFLGGDMHRPAYGVVLHALDVPYGEPKGKEDGLKDKYKKWYESIPPISPKNDNSEAVAKGLAWMGSSRINVWRSLGGWKLWLDELGRRLRFWSNDKAGEKTYLLDLDQRQTPYKLTLTTPYNCSVYIEDEADNQNIRIALPNGYQMQLQKQGGTTSGLWGKSGGAEFSFTAQDGSETLILKAPSSGSQVQIGPGGITLSTSQTITLQAAGIVLNAPSVDVNG